MDNIEEELNQVALALEQIPAASATFETVLLSWFLVQLSTSQDEQVRFEWTLKHTDSNSPSPNYTISEAEILPHRRGSIKSIASSISQIFQSAIDSGETQGTASLALVLSSGSLSRSTEGESSKVSYPLQFSPNNGNNFNTYLSPVSFISRHRYMTTVSRLELCGTARMLCRLPYNTV